jgi:GAF domain-containing protein
MVPVASGGRTIGLLEVMRSDERAFTRSQTNRLRIVSHQLGGVLESGRLGRAGDGPSLRYRGAQRLAGV